MFRNRNMSTCFSLILLLIESSSPALLLTDSLSAGTDVPTVQRYLWPLSVSDGYTCELSFHHWSGSQLLCTTGDLRNCCSSVQADVPVLLWALALETCSSKNCHSKFSATVGDDWRGDCSMSRNYYEIWGHIKYFTTDSRIARMFSQQ